MFHLETTELPYKEFFERYLARNELVVLSKDSSSVSAKTNINNWYSFRNWTKHKDDLSFFDDLIDSDTIVPVTDCDSGNCLTMTLRDYQSYWMKYKGHNDDRRLYLKDFHLSSITKKPFYCCPVEFEDDWLNEFLELDKNNNTDDYKFVYIGPKGESHEY